MIIVLKFQTPTVLTKWLETADSEFTALGLGPVVQSIVSLTSSLEVKMLIVLVNTISQSQVFLLKKMLAYMPYFFIKVLTIR